MTPERKAEMRRSAEFGRSVGLHQPDVIELLDAIDAAEAQAASLRTKLQAAHGALYFYRAPEDVNKPLSEWRWNPEAVRDIQSHCDLPALLDKTRPTADEGMSLLIEVRDLRQKLEEATLASLTCGDLAEEETHG